MIENQFTYRILGSQSWDAHDDNIDVEVTLPSGERYAATFFTKNNINTLFKKYTSTGECKSGLYVWSSNMIIVNKIDKDTIIEIIDDMLKCKEFTAAFQRLSQERGQGQERGA